MPEVFIIDISKMTKEEAARTLQHCIENSLPHEIMSSKPIKENKMERLEITKVNEIVNIFKTVCPDCFLTGSYRFDRATKNSDIDIAFPIMFKTELEKYLKIIGISETKQSHYNAGVKFYMHTVDQIINAVFLHPLDFVCWYKGANMINAANAKLHHMSRHDFHAFHQMMIALPKMMIRDCVTSTNYKEFMSVVENGQKNIVQDDMDDIFDEKD